MAQAALPLLQHVEAISSCRDRARLPLVLLEAVAALLGDGADVGLFQREAAGEPVLIAHGETAGISAASRQWMSMLDDIKNDGNLLRRCVDQQEAGVIVLQASEVGSEQLMLAYRVDPAAGVELPADEIVSLAHIYGNQIRLLDYSELDTLTRLLNRKTFDETFDRLLTAASAERDDAPGAPSERRDTLGEGSPAWLCVVDIDHFKRVNDSFGHLFGDEVLLRMGELMRKTFRGGDRLFRFGGEEFVVILNAADVNLAEASFNRFRASVEKHEFPQVGQVTCSIGFTSVSTTDVPTDVVGRADEALYYAKEHGRNQVCCYEQLVEQGAVSPAVVSEGAGEDAFDIDALFS